MSELTVGGNTYRTAKLDLFGAMHLSRKLAPLVPQLVPAFLRFKAIADAKATDAAPAPGIGLDDVASIALASGPFADALSGLSNDDMEQITALCLAVVQRQQGASWAPIWNVPGRVLMFHDIDMGVALPLMLRVIQDDLGPFISGLLSSAPEAAPA